MSTLDIVPGGCFSPSEKEREIGAAAAALHFERTGKSAQECAAADLKRANSEALDAGEALLAQIWRDAESAAFRAIDEQCGWGGETGHTSADFYCLTFEE